MLVASGDEAAEALLSQVIGTIETAIGCGTLMRVSGVAVQVMVGDPVCQGDVIETAADGRIGIRFIDGTVFNLSGDSRMVLDEFAFGSSGASHSALFAVTRGIFAFIAGKVAKTGSLRVDTPVGSIRGRAHAGGFGMLSLAALTFSIMKEAKAADPNVTFLDDDSITYKDLEHGAFELITKEAVPRHIIVEDPGETIVLSRRGSSVSVSHVENSLARMEELQAAQQDALANFAKGHRRAGSGSPQFDSSLPLEPINYIQTDTIPAQNALPPVPVMIVPVLETIIVHQPPSLNAGAGPTEIDTVVFDTFTATSGTFVASSSKSGATLTFGISGGIAGSTVLGGVTYDVSEAGPYGTLYVNSTSGAYTFVPNSDAINALTAPTTESFIITVSDGSLSASQTFTININGVNDAAIISGTTTGAVIEAGGATPGTPSATGTLTDTDVDNPPNTFTAVSSPKASTGGYGTFTITAAGVWTYTLDNANSAVQALNAGDTLTDTFTVTTIDGTPQVITVTINGTNDAAIISGTNTGSVVEAGGVANAMPGTPSATGTLTSTDVDNSANTFTVVSSPKASAGYGTFTITAAGVWTYMLDDSNNAVQALNAGDTLTDTFTVTTIDGTPQVVTITINGSNDAAVISGSTSGSVVEAGGVANAMPGTPSATGTLTDTDVDNPANAFTAVSSPKTSTGGYGTFTITAAGVWAYTLDNANSAVQALNVGDTLTDTFTVTTIDGTPQVVTITINGSNDAAIISGTTSGSVIEAGGISPGTPIVTGTLTDTDVDNPANTFMAVSSPTASDGGYGLFTMTAAGVWTYTLDNANSTVDALNVGDTLTDSFTVTTIDGTTEVVTITIHGASDADPNDFDNLAMGTVVITDPPFVYGTPGSDNIAGGGDVGQIVYGGAGNDTLNGTGVKDIIYGGSGNDTIKGNNGDDTIYGGSGNDTINGNNGNDTVIGGFGADQLTGGNGNDVFVYLSVADSRAGRFDTITDFISGSDKIDLTALGVLAFLLALTPTSTSVPAHTVAWLYDSASNETIVYVNPTDQTLQIGDSGLLEVHLQGIATVELSDFILDPPTAPVVIASDSIDLAPAPTTETDGTIVTTTTADTSSGSTVNGSMLFADESWTAQTTNVSYGFNADRDSVDLIDYARLTSSDAARAHATEDADDDAATTLASGQPIELQHVHATALTETHFVFDQLPVLGSVGAMTIGNGAATALTDTIHDASIAALNAADDRAELQLIKHGVVLEGGDWNVPSHGSSKIDSGASSTSNNEDHGASKNADVPGHAIDASSNAMLNPGLLKASESSAGHHSISGAESEHGSAPVHGAGAPHVASGSAAAGMVGVGDSFHFKDEIPGSQGSGVIDHAGLDHISALTAHNEDAAGTHGADGAQMIELLGHHSVDPFNIHAGGAGAIHTAHDLMV